MTPRMTEELAIELLTRTHGREPGGISDLIMSLSQAELRSVLVDVCCVTTLALKLASLDARNPDLGGDMLRRAAADYMAAALAT